jgi:hypothetical protein
MADEIHQFDCTIPVGTTKTNPIIIPMPMNLYTVDSIDLEQPPGTDGGVGFYLALSEQQIIPWESGEWISWDGQSGSWELNDAYSDNGWTFVGCNYGTNPHTTTVRFHLNAIADLPTPALVIPSITIISAPAPAVTL